MRGPRQREHDGQPQLPARPHGAVPERRGVDDQARWLSRRGREQAREVADAVRERVPQLTRFLTSPRVRAVQTAELFAEVLRQAAERKRGGSGSG